MATEIKNTSDPDKCFKVMIDFFTYEITLMKDGFDISSALGHQPEEKVYKRHIKFISNILEPHYQRRQR
jgi:hypothetical protein